MGFVERLKDGRYLAMFHDDGRFITQGGEQTDPVTFTLYRTLSDDGGLNWTTPEAIWSGRDIHLCEPGVVRSPDGATLAILLRENSRRRNSHVMFSEDEGATWSPPRELPASLTGDRHTAVHTPDGRLFVSFRDTTHESPTKGDWVAWVGTWDDIRRGCPVSTAFVSRTTSTPGIRHIRVWRSCPMARSSPPPMVTGTKGNLRTSARCV